jgi:hypothetical protein
MDYTRLAILRQYDGYAFPGHSIMGYDNAKKMFVNTWIDNMGSGMIFMTGTYDDATKSLTLTGKQTNPRTVKILIFVR